MVQAVTGGSNVGDCEASPTGYWVHYNTSYTVRLTNIAKMRSEF